MVIFNSYVSLPEGKCMVWLIFWGVDVEKYPMERQGMVC